MQLTTGEFLAVLFYAVSLYYPKTVDPDLKPPDTPQEEVYQEYDFIIVGAGSAGCVVASRLSEVPSWKVLLIEAGGDEDFISDTPFLYPFLAKTEKDWNYTTVPQENACLSTDGVCRYTRGRVMGGSSTVNYLFYVRGNRADYDGWEEEGNVGWSYEDVLPYFIKAENNTIPSLRGSPFHGHHGYLNVQYQRYTTKLEEQFIKAGLEFGWDEGDYNGERQDVISKVQLTMDGPSRESTSRAYLNPIRRRPNLDIVKHAVVTKVILDGNIAKGVEYFRNGKKYKVFAKKEVILSAGSVDTPKLLMLSGIGPKQELQKHNIPIKVDLPVGETFQDHVSTGIYFEINANETLTGDVWKTNSSIFQYARYKHGPLTGLGLEGNVFLNVFDKNQLPNLQIVFVSTAFQHSSQNKQIISVVLGVLDPESVGDLKLKSSNWRDPPLIDPKLLAEEYDFKVLEKGFQIVFDYMRTPTMANLEPKLYNDFFPKCKKTVQGKQKRDFVNCVIQNYSFSFLHGVGSAKMGSVVAHDLLVKHMKHLRIVDASVMPRIPRGNTNAPTIMIAEKASDIIKLQHGIKPTIYYTL